MGMPGNLNAVCFPEWPVPFRIPTPRSAYNVTAALVMPPSRLETTTCQCIHVREYYSATRRDRLPTLKRQEDFQSTVQRAKKPDKKSCVPCDPIYMRFWKWHNYRNSRWAFARGWRWERALDLGLQEVYDILSVWWLLASVHLLIWTVLWQRITSYVIIMVSDIINNLPNNNTLHNKFLHKLSSINQSF